MAAEIGNKYAIGNNGGRPPKFNSAEELCEAIRKYFEEDRRERTIIIGKAPNQQEVTLPIITVTGLARYLGFESRQSLYDYEKKEEFSYLIKRARLFIEEEYEEQLQYGNTTGAIFALKNMGWNDKIEQTTTNINYNTELTREETKEISDALEDEC